MTDCSVLKGCAVLGLTRGVSSEKRVDGADFEATQSNSRLT